MLAEAMVHITGRGVSHGGCALTITPAVRGTDPSSDEVAAVKRSWQRGAEFGGIKTLNRKFSRRAALTLSFHVPKPWPTPGGFQSI